MAPHDLSQFSGFPSYEDTLEETEDNGMTQAADLELSGTEQDDEKTLSFDEQVDKVGACVTRHPLHREILFNVLQYCSTERVLQDIEQEITTYPEWHAATQNQYFLIQALVKAGGLEYIERDEAGNIVTEADKEGLSEDEAEDLVATFNYKTTEAGQAFIDYYDPAQRLAYEFSRTPERVETYIEVLSFVGEAPRSMAEIDKLLEGREIGTFVNGRYESIKPSVFVDKLEHAGALVWDKGWKLTKEGEAYLEKMNQVG